MAALSGAITTEEEPKFRTALATERIQERIANEKDLATVIENER